MKHICKYGWKYNQYEVRKGTWVFAIYDKRSIGYLCFSGKVNKKIMYV